MANNSYGGKNLGHRRRGKLEASVRSAFILTVSMQSVIGHRRTVFVLLYRRVASIRRSDCDPDGERDAHSCRLLESSATRRVTTSAGPSVAMSRIDSGFDPHGGEGHWRDTHNIHNADSRSLRSSLRWSWSASQSRVLRICLPLPRTRTRERARRRTPPCSRSKRWSNFVAWPMVSTRVEAR